MYCNKFLATKFNYITTNIVYIKRDPNSTIKHGLTVEEGVGGGGRERGGGNERPGASGKRDLKPV